MSALNNKLVAILSTNGFEESELTSPKAALEAAGATVHVIAPKGDTIKAWRDGNWSIDVKVDKVLAEAEASGYDALVLPGGVMNPDHLRIDSGAVGFAKHFANSGKPIAAICHGPQTLIETGILQGKKMTSFPSLKTDLENAGATWVDEAVVVDEGLVTSRSPDDLPAFNKKMVEEIAEGKHERP